MKTLHFKVRPVSPAERLAENISHVVIIAGIFTIALLNISADYLTDPIPSENIIYSLPKTGTGVKAYEFQAQIIQELRKEQSSSPTHFDKIDTLETTKMRNLLTQKFPTSPLIGKEALFQGKRGALAFAIAGAETGFGTKTKQEYYNAWNYFCTRKDQKDRLDCGWTTWEQSSKRFQEVASNYLDKWNGTKGGLNEVFVGRGKYCTSGCEHWVENVWYFYNQIINF